jgi:hypothetical protein
LKESVLQRFFHCYSLFWLELKYVCEQVAKVLKQLGRSIVGLCTPGFSQPLKAALFP